MSDKERLAYLQEELREHEERRLNRLAQNKWPHLLVAMLGLGWLIISLGSILPEQATNPVVVASIIAIASICYLFHLNKSKKNDEHAINSLEEEIRKLKEKLP